MSFAFNFNIDEQDDERKDVAQNTGHGSNVDCGVFTNQDDLVQIEDAVEIHVDWRKELERITSYPVENVNIHSDLCLKVISSDSVQMTLCQKEEQMSAVVKALQAKSDLVPNQYEGGLKIWECSVDLVKYLASMQIPFGGCAVLELGCGAGLPGIYAFKQGASVTFQDYNTEVLTVVTAANILLASDDAVKIDERCRLIAGDWSKVQTLLLDGNFRYDYILTSETIYSLDSYKKLHDIMKYLIKESGVVFMSAKTHYFGVGGGTREFEDYLDKEGVFDHIVCKEYTTGVHREILKLTLKK